MSFQLISTTKPASFGVTSGRYSMGPVSHVSTISMRLLWIAAVRNGAALSVVRGSAAAATLRAGPAGCRRHADHLASSPTAACLPRKKIMSFTPGVIRSGLVALAATLPAFPAAAADYFAGKSIDLLIGAPPGGGYDIYARALARHYGRHIPGHPLIVAKNMPGAGSARAAGYISAVAPRDGTAIAAIMPGAVMGPLLEEKAEALFDPTKVLYLGTANSGTRICVSRKDSKIKTFDDAISQKAVFGGVSNNDSTRDYGFMHKKT